MNNYYNTTSLSGNELLREVSGARNQDEIILSFFKENPTSELTPFNVLSLCKMNCPITSIRRSMTNLTNKGFLEKTENKKLGEYGKKNYTWKLKRY
jgi:predicted transcriptional regulator